MEPMPFVFCEEWWNWVWANFRTTLIVIGNVLTGYAALSKGKRDDKLVAMIKDAMPFPKTKGGDTR